MDYNSFLDLVKSTRSIRRFKPDPIPDEYVDKIIEVARWAPSGFNQQPWDFIVVKKPQLRNKIVEFCRVYGSQSAEMESTREPWQKGPKWAPVRDANDFSMAPVFIIVCGDIRTNEGLPMALRYNPDRLQSVFTSSLANAFLYMHMAATALGLGSQWVSSVSTSYAHCMTKELLGIPKELEIYDMLALGYPAIKPRPKLLKDKNKTIHYDNCGPESFRNDDEVKDFIRRARNWNIGAEKRRSER